MEENKLKFIDNHIWDNDKVGSFFPIKVLLRRDDYKEILDKTENTWIYLWMNNGISDYENSNSLLNLGLNKTFFVFQEMELVISFLVRSTDNDNLINVLEDIRLSLQNFMFSLEMSNYCIAFTEFRKVLEGMLWIELFKKDINNLNREKLTDSTFMDEWRNHLPEYINFWKMLSKLVHHSNKKKQLVIFNAHPNIYDSANELEKYLIEVVKIAPMMLEQVYSLREIFDNQHYILKLKELFKIMFKNTPSMRDKDVFNANSLIKATNNLFLEKSNEEILNKIKETHHKKYIMKFIEDYVVYLMMGYGMDITFCHGVNKYAEKVYMDYDVLKLFQDSKFLYYNKRYNKPYKELSKWSSDMNLCPYLFFGFSTTTKILWNVMLEDARLTLLTLTFYAMIIMKYELENDFNNPTLHCVRTYIEECLFSFACSKYEMYGFYKSFADLIKSTGVKLRYVGDDYKFKRHLLIKDRISYSDNYGKSTGERNEILEFQDNVLWLIEDYLCDFFKCSIEEVYKNNEDLLEILEKYLTTTEALLIDRMTECLEFYMFLNNSKGEDWEKYISEYK